MSSYGELLAQRVGSKDAKREMGFSSDEDFNITSFPDKWKEESAVILCQKHDFSYIKHGLNKIKFNVIIRRRVFINDQKAKDEYSIFYFIERNGENDHVGYIVEKPDGEKINVDLSDAVEVGANEVSAEYRSYYSYNDSYKKIAIPNLEVGDIIDYYVIGSKSYDGSSELIFSQFSFSLASKYPIIKQKFFFNVDKGFKVNFRAFNGAPEIVEGEPGINKQGRQKDKIKTYIVEDDNRDKKKYEYWKSYTLEEPWIKFQVYYAMGSQATKSIQLISKEKDLVNSPIDLETIRKKIVLDKRMVTMAATDINELSKRLRKVGNVENKAEYIYYYLKYWYFKQLRSYTNFDYENGDYANINYMRFANLFAALLNKFDIPYKYVIAVDRDNGGFDNVIFTNDLTTGIKVKSKYFFYFDNNSLSTDIPSYILGTDAMEFYTDRKHKDEKAKMVKIPVRDYNYNALHSSLKVSFNESMDTTYIINSDSIVGSMKDGYSKLVLYKTSYLDQDKEYLFPEKVRKEKEEAARKSKNGTRKSKRSIRETQEKERTEAQEKQELKEWRSDYIIDFFENDFKIAKVDSVVVASSGRLPNSPYLLVNSYFRAEDFISKAGRNYIFNIGSLIGHQLELETEDMKREADINVTNVLSYNFNIELQIPDGYYVENVDALDYNIVSDLAEFTAKATIDGNIIRVNTSKKYKTLYASKDDWNKYIDFLEAAYEFSQKKIIIKKNK